MKFAIRREVSFDKPDFQLSGLAGVPIELALPHMMETFFAGQSLLPAVAAFARAQNVIVQSVHAPQGRLTDEHFMDWSLATARFAESVGASLVVFHPEATALNRHMDMQIIASCNIKRLQRETTVKIAVESFGNKKRILTPEEIIQKDIPFVLDTSHLFPERTMEIVERYSPAISAVHLSEPRDGRQHMPVEGLGFQVLDVLQARGWNGNVTLEYLPEFHHRLIPDMKMLQERYG
ncbi:MAG: sugar phosphate isomerase/epimerase family protein [Thermodesulfovibrionales bacterium]